MRLAVVVRAHDCGNTCEDVMMAHSRQSQLSFDQSRMTASHPTLPIAESARSSAYGVKAVKHVPSK